MTRVLDDLAHPLAAGQSRIRTGSKIGCTLVKLISVTSLATASAKGTIIRRHDRRSLDQVV
jgi:hypothetical protein